MNGLLRSSSQLSQKRFGFRSEIKLIEKAVSELYQPKAQKVIPGRQVLPSVTEIDKG